MKDTIIEIILGIVIGIIVTSFIGFAHVNGASMDSTLHDGQTLFVQKHFQSYSHGDIVIANITKITDGKNLDIVKRVIGMPGDTIEIKDNVVYVNNKALVEDYIKEPMTTKDMSKITLEDDEYFLMGDNRNNSYDSRIQGVINASELKAKVIIKF